MGARDRSILSGMRVSTCGPADDEIELTLFGPGYGESAVLHIGGGVWVIVDSCMGTEETPRPLEYLTEIGIDPGRAVELIVASHWHDDHIRGMAQLVETCGKAAFCCASALCQEEFLVAVGALEGRSFSAAGSGVREVHRVFSRLVEVGASPTLAVANRLILSRNGCNIWALSPNDSALVGSLRSIGRLVPKSGEPKLRLPSLSPNRVSVALWISFEDTAVLLGSDVERGGWVDIVQDTTRPAGRASAFKVPHHGSSGADEPDVWERMLKPGVLAALAPWRRGRHRLPTPQDAERLLSNTPNVWITAGREPSAPNRKIQAVERTIREAGIELRRTSMPPGAIRMRRPVGDGSPWQVETLGSACHLREARV